MGTPCATTTLESRSPRTARVATVAVLASGRWKTDGRQACLGRVRRQGLDRSRQDRALVDAGATAAVSLHKQRRAPTSSTMLSDGPAFKP